MSSILKFQITFSNILKFIFKILNVTFKKPSKLRNNFSKNSSKIQKQFSKFQHNFHKLKISFQIFQPYIPPKLYPTSASKAFTISFPNHFKILPRQVPSQKSPDKQTTNYKFIQSFATFFPSLFISHANWQKRLAKK